MLLKRLWNSTASLHARFGIIPLPLPVRKVFEEEVSELLEAAAIIDHFEAPDASPAVLHVFQRKQRKELVEEAADVIVTVCAFLQAYDIDPAEFEAGINAVIDKNNNKTHETHERNAAGKIARRQKD